VARDDPRCLPPARTLRRIRWPLRPQSHDRRAAFGERDDRWATFRRYPGSRPDDGPFSERPTPRRQRSVRRTHRTALGPLAAPSRSLFTPAVTLFGALRVSLFETRTLPADFCNNCDVRALSSGLSIPRRDDGHDHLPFLTRHALSLVAQGAVTRGEPHIRPTVTVPVPVPPARAGLPDRDTLSIAPARVLAQRESTGDRRARVSGPSEGRVLERGGAGYASPRRVRAPGAR
jgi:hypothetical protein